LRRAVFAILGTAAATSLLVTLKAQQPDAPQLPSAATAPAQPADEPSPRGPANAPAGTGPAAPRKGGASKTAGPAPVNGTFSGRTVTTLYGPVTVKITLAGGKMTDVAAALPQNGRSAEVSGFAGPQLRQQALTRQSATLDTVSGATYTSDGYRQSLQSALDQVKRG
jgi:uncharacterized protein with FMN-binding domain